MESRSACKAASIIFLAIVLFGVPRLVRAQLLQEGVTYRPDGIVVALKAAYSPISPTLQNGIISTGIAEIDRLNSKFGVQTMWPLFPAAEMRGEPEMAGYYSIRFTPGFDLEQVLAAYGSVIAVDHVEPIGIHRVNFIPNDPSLGSQWAITKIHARQAWDVTHGSASIPLGIADTGVDWNHPDLDNNIWINTGDPVDGSDNDGNGYIDDYHGWDWVNNENGVDPDLDTPDNNPMDFYGHGTHCSGIASAETNNSTGIAGVGFNCKIMCLRIGWAGYFGFGYVDMSYAASAFYYAANEGAKAVNCSWGSDNSGGIAAAADYARDHGVLIVSAAGNDDNTTAPYLCTRADVIAVAATNGGDTKADFSNYGTWVDVSAPGVNIYSTYFDNTYTYMDGTSMAAPHVVGLVGLINAVAPSLTRAQVQSQIINTTDDIDALNPGYAGLLGSGRINAYSAVSGLGNPPGVPVPISPVASSWIGTPRPTLVWQDTSGADFFHVQVDNVSNFSSPITNDSTGNIDTTYTMTDSLSEGMWYWRVRAGAGSMWSSYSATQSFRVDLQDPNTITLVAPVAGSFTSDRTPYFDWNGVTDPGGSGINRYFIQADTDSLFAAPVTMNDSVTYTYYNSDYDLPGDTRIFWRVRARDNAGNFSVWSTSSFTIDISAPASPIGFSIMPDDWSGDPNFSMNWTNPVDVSGIAMARYKAGSAPISNNDTTGHFGGVPPATFVASTTGTFAFYLWLVDGAGNGTYTTAARDTFRFDNTPPSGCVASSPPISSSLNVAVSWGGETDIGSGPAGLYDIRSMDSATGVWSNWLTVTGLVTANFVGQHGHTYYFEARAIDLAGNAEPFAGVAECQTQVDTNFVGPPFVPGDANGNGAVNGIDVVFLVAYLKGTGAAPDPLLAGDANGNCAVNGIDVVYLVAYLKGIGAAPFAGDCNPY